MQIPFVIGHRGAAGLAPENTLAAIRKAHAVGVSWVEFDVMLTGCGTAVAIHDSDIARTTTGKGRVGKLTYADILQQDAGSWFATEYQTERVPTLVEMLEQLKKFNLGVNIEIKPYPGMDRQTALTTLGIVRQMWPATMPPPLFSSFSLRSLKVLRSADATINLALLLDHWQPHWKKTAKDLSCIAVNLNHQLLNQARAAAIKQAGYLLICYTVNSAKQALQYAAWGADAVITDYPDRILPVTQ